MVSVVSSLLIGILLIVENYIHTPAYPWFLYTVIPLVITPILVSLGKKVTTMPVAIMGSATVILYYVMLNVFLFPPFPWAIFPAFAVLSWPLVIYHVQKRAFFRFSINATLFISLFLIIVNAITTPYDIWAIYPIFVILWWPLSMYFFVHKRLEYNTKNR